MQFRRQGTKVFIKLELRKIHIFISQYSFIQLLLICQKTIHCIQVQIGCIGYMRVNKSDIYVNHKRRDIV